MLPEGEENTDTNDEQGKADGRKIPLKIKSEFGRLRAVMVHRPGPEIDRLTPSNKYQLLFEDIPFLERMQKEHDEFVRLMRKEDIEVLYFHELLQQVLKDERVCRKLVMSCCRYAQYPGLASALLEHYSTAEIGNILLEGITAKELEVTTSFEITPRIVVDRKGRRIVLASEDQSDPFLIAPLPNMYFMRDPGVVFDSGFVSTKMHFDARVRETMLLREVLTRHPLFAGTPIWYGAGTDEDRPFTIEGGDVIVISERAIAVGASQRTRPETIRRFAQRLFEQHLVDRVYEVPIPANRAYMHLDTVFTIIDRARVVTYPRVMDEVVGIRRYEPVYADDDTVVAFWVEERRSFVDVLGDEFGAKLEIVQTGDGNERHAAREQASDGTNVLALAPGLVITYDRNRKTNEALEKVHAKVIDFDGSELVRGLGGPRCMTMPLWRDEVDHA